MKKVMGLIWILAGSFSMLSQSIDEDFSIQKMKKDLQVFKAIRMEANSGLYKYRTEKEMDSIYLWADRAVEKSHSYRDFYNIINHITDFEGSLHNDTSMPAKYYKAMKVEKSGYCPLQIKFIEGKALMNLEGMEIPLGSEILSIDGETLPVISKNLFKYYTTDGYNITGKFVGINDQFSKYYRLHYGRKDRFEISYRIHGEDKSRSISLSSVGYLAAANLFDKRHSAPIDTMDYVDPYALKNKYSYQKVNPTTGLLTIHTFLIGLHAKTAEHEEYIAFLDSVFLQMKNEDLANLIIDVRHNGGGSDPNDLVTYSYLAQQSFVENKQGWIAFNKIPQTRYIKTWVPRFLRFISVFKYNLYFRQEFPVFKEGGYYQDDTSSDHAEWFPNKNAFSGQIYMLISPRIASAGSLFAALVARDDNVIIVGEETMGGYYGHNGHFPIEYILPNSKLKITFSIVNLEQDVVIKANQPQGRGIMPTHRVLQTYDDFILNKDIQFEEVKAMINQ